MYVRTYSHESEWSQHRQPTTQVHLGEEEVGRACTHSCLTRWLHCVNKNCHKFFLNSTVVLNNSSTQRQFIVCCVLWYPFQSHPTTGSHVALWVGMYRVMKLVYWLLIGYLGMANWWSTHLMTACQHGGGDLVFFPNSRETPTHFHIRVFLRRKAE